MASVVCELSFHGGCNLFSLWVLGSCGCGRYEYFRSVAVGLDIELEKLVVGCCVGMVSVMAAAC